MNLEQNKFLKFLINPSFMKFQKNKKEKENEIMKRIKKIASLLLAMVMVFAMSVTAFATESETPADAKGSIVINSATNVSVAGKTFNAYKVLDMKKVGADGYAYTVPEGLKAFYSDRYGIAVDSADFSYEVAQKIGAETDMFAFGKAVLQAAKDADIQPATAKGEENATSVTIDNLDLGYYVVEDASTSGTISALMLQTAGTVDINVKADQPGIDKNIVEDEEDKKTNNVAVGDIIDFKLTSTVPDMTGYEKYFFVVNDTMSKGLTFDKNSVVIKIGTDTLGADAYTVESVTDETGETKIKIVFRDFLQYRGDASNVDGVISYQDNKAGKAIVITYQATLNENAVIGVAGNPNKVNLVYSNDPNKESSGKPGSPDEPDEKDPTGQTPDSETRTYVTGIELIKHNADNDRLVGAQFEITGTKLNKVLVRKDVYTEDVNGEYWKLKDGSYTKDDPAAEGMDTSKYESTTTKYAKKVETQVIEKAEEVKYTAEVGADGVLRFEGLAAGDYVITEIKAPDGYNKLDTPINVTINWAAPAEGTGTNCTWTSEGREVVDGVIQVPVLNNTGSLLPSTGGIGTTIFYVVGGILVIGAGILLVTKRRMKAQ